MSAQGLTRSRCYELGVCLMSPACGRRFECAMEERHPANDALNQAAATPPPPEEPLLFAETCTAEFVTAAIVDAVCAFVFVGCMLLGLRYLWSNWP